MIATVRPFELALSSPLGTARGTIETGRGMLFDVFDKPSGLGEAMPVPPFTEPYEDCIEVLGEAADAYTDGGWKDGVRPVTTTVDGRIQYPAARHAVSLAYLDQQARVTHKPLYRHLGGADVQDSVPIEATIGDHSAEKTVELVSDAVESGYRAVKIRVGDQPVSADETRVRAVRAAVGSDIDVRLDANGGWSFETAREFIDRTEDLALDFIEQPLDPDDFSGHASLRGRGVDIALDESVSMYAIDELRTAEAGDVFVLKPMTMGGIDIARATAIDLLNDGFRAVFSTSIESVVARTGAIHAAATIPEVPPSGLATGSYLEADLAEDPTTNENGRISLPETPGLGIDEIEIE